MALDQAEVPEMLRKLVDMRAAEAERLDTIQDYLRDDPDKRVIGGLPSNAPADVIRLARLSRVNLLKYIVNARVQNMYIDGFRTPTSPDDLEVWQAWQANRMDKRQIGINRAALSFGTSYATLLPGEPVPVMRGYSPRQLTAAFGDDDEWPEFALICLAPNVYKLLDDVNRWKITKDSTGATVVENEGEHGATWQGEPVCPVVRFRDTDDLDDPGRGVVEPFYPLQDQVNITTFGLQVAQHYGAFRQRYAIGWLAETEEEALRASASRFMNFEDGDITVGEFSQTDLTGYINSREATIRHLATVSQTPVHELLGQFVNLSAEALEAARASHAAGVEENRIVCGESYEQLLNLSAEMMGLEVDPMASVLWRDTRVRSLKDAAEALGALVEKLGVPPKELWHLIPGIPQHEVERWTVAASQADSMGQLMGLLDRQAAPAAGPAPVPAPPAPAPAPVPVAA